MANKEGKSRIVREKLKNLMYTIFFISVSLAGAFLTHFLQYCNFNARRWVIVEREMTITSFISSSGFQLYRFHPQYNKLKFLLSWQAYQGETFVIGQAVYVAVGKDAHKVFQYERRVVLWWGLNLASSVLHLYSSV